MVEVSLARGWDLDVERGPDWLFVRPRPMGTRVVGAPNLAEQIWALLEQHFTHRLVLELEAVGRLDSPLIAQLVWLQERIQDQDGIMRVCGLSRRNQDLLRQRALDGRLPSYRDREEAVMGQSLPRQPR